MECLLHIAYRLEIKCWQVRTPEHKRKLLLTKSSIQKNFKRRLGLLIDVPKHGSGSSNDGNTARRFFEDPQATAEITGLDKQIIEKFAVIVSVLACGRKINVAVFRSYCFNTALRYVRLYQWFYMPQSVHRILMHGADIIEAALLPIGCLSEEPQECRNKDLKRFREKRARKCSRVATNQDIFKRLLLTSDPFIANLRKPSSKKSRKMLPEAKKLLLSPPDQLSDSGLDTSDDVEDMQ